MRFDRPEIWTLAAIFTIAGLILVFGHIAEEVAEGDATKFEAKAASEMSKLGEMYVGLTRNVYKPVEQAAAKAASKRSA
jgi:hypothetical protein